MKKEVSLGRTRSLVVFITLMVILSAIGYSVPVIVSGGPENDYEGWILRLNDTRLMVIFCRNPDWASGDLYVTFSSDNGDTWDTVQSIIVEQGDQATLSFLQLPGETLRVWYASNEDGQYGIYSAFSMDGIHWTPEGRIDLGWQQYDMYYDPTVIMEMDSSLTMSYRGPGGAYIAHSPHEGTWDTLRTMVGSGGYRPRIMKHDNGTYLYAYHRNTGSGYEVFTRTSTDRIIWSNEVQLTFNNNSHDPFPNETPEGAYLVYYATYLAPAYNLYRRRSFDAINWEAEEQITFDITNNTQPHFFIEPDSQIYLLWAHCVSYPYEHDVYFERSGYISVHEESNERLFSFKAYPNPCQDLLTIKSKGRVELGTVTLYSSIGQVVKRTRITAEITRLDVSSLPDGVYFLQSDCPDRTHEYPIVIVR